MNRAAFTGISYKPSARVDTDRVLTQSLDNTDQAQQGQYKKGCLPIFSRYSPEQAWLMTKKYLVQAGLKLPKNLQE